MIKIIEHIDLSEFEDPTVLSKGENGRYTLQGLVTYDGDKYSAIVKKDVDVER